MGLVDTFQNRLRKAMELEDLNQVELAEKSGIERTLLNKYLAGITSPKQSKLCMLASALNVNEVWLMGYDVDRKPISRFTERVEPVSIPVLGRISAGLPLFAEENLEGYEYAPASYTKSGYKYFYLRVQGDSMNKKFNDGDMVLVQSQSELEDKDIGVILVNDEATVKRYREESGLVILEPMSYNEKHENQYYNPKETRIKIIGKVVSYQGKV